MALIGKTKGNVFIHYLAIYGCFSTGLIYLGIGVMAILSFLKIRNGGADEASLLANLNNSVIGTVLVWIILFGTASYVLWRLYEAIKDPYKFGKDFKGIAIRVAIALSTIADILIVYSAITATQGTSTANEDGRPTALRESIAAILNLDKGAALTISIGAIILLTAIVQLVYGTTQGYKERLTIENLHKWKQRAIHFLGIFGYIARGIILGIIGFFFVKAGVFKNALHVVNTDKAFDFIGDDVGHFYFILIAVGTICYGFFMFLIGYFYNTKTAQNN